MAKDLHEKPFEEGTLAKLEIFEAYTQAWLPTFIMQKKVDEIHIFDFFAGTGYDKEGNAGSPIRVLKKIEEQRGNLFSSQVVIKLHLNEFKKYKFQQLKATVNKYLEDHKGLEEKVAVNFYNDEFENLFTQLQPTIKKHPSLIFIDQNGIRFLNINYLKEFERLRQTDFLYFVSSSYLWRFGYKEEFKQHFDFDLEKAKKDSDYNSIHRYITEELKRRLPANSELKLYPFSLRKGSNIYGIIFGATHPRAVDKFLQVAWDANQMNGDANFDIDDDAPKGQLHLFEGKKLTKRESFQEEVRRKVLSGEIKDNKALLEFCYEKGHIPTHAKECLGKMKTNKEVNFAGKFPKVNYDKVFKERDVVKFEVLKKGNK